MPVDSRSNDVLVIILAYNEEKNVGSVIDDVRKYFCMADILVVDDGSEDNTAGVAVEKGVFFVRHVFNLGIGASLETAFRFACINGYEYIVRMDADGQHRAHCIQDLIGPVKTGEIDIAIGSRFLGKSEFKTSFLRTCGIRLIAAFLRLITGVAITDPTSGFCAMSKKAFLFFADNCADDYPEPEILIYHRDFRIKEIPISIAPRRAGVSSITPGKSVYYMYKVMFSILLIRLKSIHCFSWKHV